jgi:hypothetical protein
LLESSDPGVQRGLSGLTSENQDDRTQDEKNRPKTALISEKTAPQEVSHGSFTNLLMKSPVLISYFPHIWQEIRLGPDEITGWAGTLQIARSFSVMAPAPKA